MEITYNNLSRVGFKPWDDERSSNWLLEPEFDKQRYNHELDCWNPTYRITLVPLQNKWDCVAWYSNDTDKKKPIFRKVEVQDITSMEDIQKVADICGIDLNFKL